MLTLLLPKNVLRTTALAALCGLLSVANPVFAEEASPIPKVTEGFRFAVTPYVWTPHVKGSLDYNNTQIAEVSMSTGTILKSLSAGAMLNGTMHYGRWGLMGNATYAKLKPPGVHANLKEEGVTVDANTDLWMGVYTLAGTYTAYAGDTVYLDLLAGARFLNLNTKTDLDASVAQLGYSKDTTLYSGLNATDAVAGAQGRIRLGGSRFFVPFYLDAGGGSAVAKFTSQQILGVGYTFDALDMMLVYNNIYYSLNKNQYSAYINMGGPAVAATFRF